MSSLSDENTQIIGFWDFELITLMIQDAVDCEKVQQSLLIGLGSSFCTKMIQ